jgi:hypothetical protein
MESSTRQHIAAEVRAEMARQRKTGREVGEVLGRARGKSRVSRQAVSAKLRGVVGFTSEELVALAFFLNVPVTKFVPEPAEVAS